MPWFGGIGYVSQVEHELDEELFVLAISRIKVFICDSSTDLAKLNEMLGHVRCEHCSNDDVAHTLVLSPVQVDHPVVGLVSLHKLEGGCQVMVLEDTDVVVADRHCVIHIDEERRGDSWVLVVVESG